MSMHPSSSRRRLLTAAMLCLGTTLMFVVPVGATVAGSFTSPFNGVQTIASTVPKHGDVNPYGVAVVPATSGGLTAGDVLVSNFNNHRNLQGTGSTIVEVSPGGTTSLFASLDPNKLPGACPGGLGLTTALVALKSGWVVVGSLPTKDGSSATMQSGSSPTRTLVPCSTVTGRSVLLRSVRQGTPRTVVSSWMPPESVSTSRAWATSLRKSR